jgi:TP901 family phage tail tape measure protein
MAGRQIRVEVVGDARQLEAALGRASTRTQNFGKDLQRTGRTLTTHMTLPIVAAGAAAVKFAADFDSSMERIQGLVGANTKQMARYRKSILDLAPAVAQGPRELADALYFVTSSGFRGAQALDILRQSAKASTAGLGDTKTIADLVTSAMTAYGTKALSAAQATDILVAATKAGKGDPQEFAQALQLNVAAANTLGISFDQLAAATAALSTVNSNVSEDATQLSGIMTALSKPTREAEKEMHRLGLSAAGLRQEVRDKGLLDTLLDLQHRTHGNVAELNKLFPNIRGARGFFTLVGKAAQKNVSIFDQVAHSTGDMNKAFQTALTNDPKAQFEKLTAQLQVLAIVVGETLIPILLRVAGAVVSVLNEFNGLSGGMQNAVLIGVALLAALGPVVSIVGTITTVVTGAAAAFRALAAGELLAAGPITLIIVAVAALAFGLVVAYQRSETFRNIVNGAFNAVKHAAGTVADFIRGPLAAAFSVIKNVAGRVIEFIRDHWRIIATVIGGPVIGAIILVATHLHTIRDVAGSALGFMHDKFQSVVGPIQSVIRWIGSVIDKVASLVSWIGRIHWPSPPGWLTGSLLSHFASGTMSARGGLAVVGERGPELVAMPRGSRVWPAGETRNMLGRSGGGGSQPIIVYTTVTLDGRAVGQSVQRFDGDHRRQNGGRGAFADGGLLHPETRVLGRPAIRYDADVPGHHSLRNGGVVVVGHCA